MTTGATEATPETESAPVAKVVTETSPVRTESAVVQMSKYMSFVLRHNPEAAGLKLDTEGWVDIDLLIKQANKTSGAIRKLGFNREAIEKVVNENNKKRFTISDDGKRIRAAQGHSSKSVDMTFEQKDPPDILYHGTSKKGEYFIQDEGLKPMTRQYVHLSADLTTAVEVGKRHGKPVVYTVRAKVMSQEGKKFFLSENGVWLTKDVPVAYLSKLIGDPEAIAARLRERARK